MASLSQGRTAAAQCGLFTHKSVPVIFEPPCISRAFIVSGNIYVNRYQEVEKKEIYLEWERMTKDNPKGK